LAVGRLQPINGEEVGPIGPHVEMREVHHVLSAVTLLPPPGFVRREGVAVADRIFV